MIMAGEAPPGTVLDSDFQPTLGTASGGSYVISPSGGIVPLNPYHSEYYSTPEGQGYANQPSSYQANMNNMLGGGWLKTSTPAYGLQLWRGRF
jgi:hypothetical protein